MNLHRHFAALAVLLASQACVPITDDPVPRGAAGFTLTPTPASAGVPFLTADGYTITVNRLVLAVSASSGDSGTQGTSIFYGSTSGQVYATGIRERAAPISLAFTHFRLGEPGASYADVERSISDTDFARMQATLDFSDARTFNEDGPISFGPSVLLALRAVRGGQSVRVDVTLGVFNNTLRAEIPVQRNALAVAAVSVDAQALFKDGNELRFAAFVAADSNADGTVSPGELRAAPTTPSQLVGIARNPPENLGSLLATRGAQMLQLKP
jgi:hypothetical protein